MTELLKCTAARSRGHTLLETIVALAAMSIVAAATIQLVNASRVQRRTMRQRETALAEAQRVMERLTALPAADLSQDRLALEELSDAAKQLPGARLNVVASDVTAPAGKRLRVEVDWLLIGGQRAAPVALTAWTYPHARTASRSARP